MQRPSDELIVDRAQADVYEARVLADKLLAGTATQEERELWLSRRLKGAWNDTDLNRIEAWVAYLAEALRQRGYIAAVTPKPPVLDWTSTWRPGTTTVEIPVAALVFTGGEQSFVVPYDGVYTIEAAGAAGAAGNGYNANYQSAGGDGAKLTAEFQLQAGDRLRVVVGGMGSVTNSAAKDGTSGGGGGCTMVLREIDSIQDSRYQFTKDGVSFEVLLLAAGGGGGNDASYQTSGVNGAPGEGAGFKSPSNYTAASTTTSAAGSATGSVMGIQQYISNNAAGASYSRDSGKAQGGYGCGGAQDDNPAFGGGWCNGTASYSAASWCLDTEAVGEDGANSEEGYVTLSFIGEETEYFYRDTWLEKDIPTRAEIDRIRANVNALQEGFYSLSDWRDILFNNTVDLDQANALEWDLQRIDTWLSRMVQAFLIRRSGTVFTIAGGVFNR